MINYAERNPEEELSKLVQLRRDMYMAETAKTQVENATERIRDSTSSDNSQTMESTVDNGDGLGHSAGGKVADHNGSAGLGAVSCHHPCDAAAVSLLAYLMGKPLFIF
jgi:hypothetical protein